MTYLRKTYDQLKQELIDALEGEGFPYNPLTTEFTAHLATALGSPNAYLRESLGKLLAEIDAQYGGSLSERYVTVAHLMDDAVANIGAGGGGGGGDVWLMADGVTPWLFADGITEWTLGA